MALTRPRALQIFDLDYKQAVRAITTANITLSGGAPNTVDGVTLAAGDRILVNGQGTASQNGIYEVQTLGTGVNGTWVRTVDAATTGTLLAGSIVMVTEGTVYADTQWKLVSDNPIVIGTTPLTWEQNSAFAFGNIYANGTAVLANTVGDTLTLSNGNNIVITGNAATKSVTIAVTESPSFTGTLSVTGNANVGNLGTAGQVAATGNITGGNLNTAGQVVADGNVSGGNISAAAAISAGTTVTATGNVTGGNLVTTGLTSTNTLAASGNANVGNLGTAGQVTATGNVSGGNILTGGIVTATGNITGGNLITVGEAFSGTLRTTGDALINGNLTVQGNLKYINVEDLRIEDPVIIMGTGPNGAPLTSNDGLDRGIYMEYYTTGLGNAFVGWQNSTGNIIIANDVDFVSNDVIQVNSYGTLQAGNAYLESAVVVGNIEAGNISTSGTLTTSGNLSANNLSATNSITAGTTITATGNVTGGNVITAGLTSSGTLNVTANANVGNLGTAGQVSATGNITGGNLVTAGAVDAGAVTSSTTITATGNVSGGNVTTAGAVDAGAVTSSTTITATGNVSGGNLVTAGVTDTGSLNAASTITATGNITGGNILTAGLASSGTLNVTANANVGNLGTAGQVTATGNITGGNVVTAGIVDAGAVTSSTTIAATGNVSGGNLTTVGQVTATGNVSGGNVNTTGTVTSSSLTATGNVTGGNINTVGQVVATGNVTGGNLIGTNVTGTLLTNAQPNITSVGTLTSLDVTGNISGGNVSGTNLTGTLLTANQPNITDVGTLNNLTVAGNTVSGTGTFGNITISGSNINSDASRITFNSDGSDVDFAIDGDTNANVFYVDAGTETVSIGNSTQTTGATLSINSTDSVLMPRGDTAERPDPGAIGMTRYNTEVDGLEVYTQAGWKEVGAEFTVIASETFSGDDSTVSFTLSTTQTTDSCIVSINGIVQEPVTAYSVSGTTLTFTEAPLVGDTIEVRTLTTTTTVTGLANSPGNAKVTTTDTSGNVVITGDLVPNANVTFDLGTTSTRWRDLYLSGNSIILGDLVIKNTGGNTVGFFGPDGTTPGTIDSTNIDATSVSNGTSSIQVFENANIAFSAGGVANVAVLSGDGLSIVGDLSVTGNATLTGNILGDRIQNGTTQIDIQTQSGNANITVGGVSNVAVFTTTGAVFTNVTTSGTVSATGNISGGNVSGTNLTGTLLTAAQTNITSVGTLSALTVTGNVSGGNLTTAGLITATGNISGGNVSGTNLTGTLLTAAQTNITSVGTLSALTVTGTVTGGNLSTAGTATATGNITGGNLITAGLVSLSSITKSGSNGVGNIGQSDNTFNTVFARATSALYADLAEQYLADGEYGAGTVLVFGGAAEVTESTSDADHRVAGVVSTDPAYIMNAGLTGAHVTMVALTGRVPCRVRGPVRKGDLMVSTGLGHARADNSARAGTIIGKALEDFDGESGVIEVVVGRH